jgi:hypothetical protein
MPVSITWNTTGAWGTGIGPLAEAQVDANFYSVKQAVEALEADRPQPNNIASITTAANGTQWIVWLDDGTPIGPLPIPVLQYRDRGPFVGFMVLAPLDVFAVEGVGVFSVTIAHTAAATFDETASGTPIAAAALVADNIYKIASIGTTDFTAIGAASNTVGVVFIATGAGTGTGTAGPLLYRKIIGRSLLDGAVASDASTARTLELADAERWIRTTNNVGIAVTIPLDADVAFSVGVTVAFEQVGTGPITVAGDGGVTLNCASTHTPVSNGQFSVIQVKKVGLNEWTVFGNLEPA